MKKAARVALASAVAMVIVAESVVLAGSLNGWFDGRADDEVINKVVISSEYICKGGEEPEFITLSAEEYEEIVKNEKSFVIFVDQAGCTTADGLRSRLIDYAKKKGIKINRILFENMKNTSLHDKIRYYPSVAIVSDGDVKAFLRSDSDKDAPIYDDYDMLEKWLNQWLAD